MSIVIATAAGFGRPIFTAAVSARREVLRPGPSQPRWMLGGSMITRWCRELNTVEFTLSDAQEGEVCNAFRSLLDCSFVAAVWKPRPGNRYRRSYALCEASTGRAA